MDEMSEDEIQLVHETQRRDILDAMLTVIDRRAEFLELVASSEHADHARQRLVDEWGLTEIQAVAALDLQVRRFATLERRRIADERAEIDRYIASETPSG